jgi:hypothetical protein
VVAGQKEIGRLFEMVSYLPYMEKSLVRFQYRPLMKVAAYIKLARCYIVLDAMALQAYEAAMAQDQFAEAVEILYSAYAKNSFVLDHGVFAGYLNIAYADIKLGALTRTGVVREDSRPRSSDPSSELVEP